VTGIEQRNDGARTTVRAGVAAIARLVAVAAVALGVAGWGRPPSVRTVIAPASKPITTEPSRSVRRTRAPAVASRSIVALAGWP
jgi:hypothetical protein